MDLGRRREEDQPRRQVDQKAADAIGEIGIVGSQGPVGELPEKGFLEAEPRRSFKSLGAPNRRISLRRTVGENRHTHLCPGSE